MRAKHRQTLKAIFSTPTPAGMVFADIESLLTALGAELREGEGSRIVFELNGQRLYLHRPHPGKEARRYQVEAVRDFLRSLEVLP